jgi:hypothetical protein
VVAGSATDVAAEAVTTPVKVGATADKEVVNVGETRSAFVASVVESAVPPYVTAVSAGSATDVAPEAVTVPVKVGATADKEVVNVGETRSALVPTVVVSASRALWSALSASAEFTADWSALVESVVETGVPP